MAVLNSQLRLSLLDNVSGPAKRIGGMLSGLKQQVAFANPLRSLTGQVLAFGGAYLGVTQGFSRTYGAAADSQAALTEIGIKAGLSSTQLGLLQQRLTALAPKVNQTTTELLGGVDAMTTLGLSAGDAEAALPAIAKTATATGSSLADLSAASVAAMQNLKVAPSEITNMLEAMASAGNSGAFETRDMAAAFPQLTAAAQALGMKGVAGITDMAAALQIARRGAGDASTAANNMSNFMGKIMSPEVIKNFKKFGVSVTAELQKAHKKGVSPIQHFIELVDEKTDGGKADLLGQLFGDKQVLDFVRPMIADFKDYLKIRGEAENASGVVAEAYARRMEDAHQKSKAFWISMDNLGQSIGANFLGPVGDGAQRLADIFNTLDQRFTIFDRVKASAEGLLSGFGAGDWKSATKDFETFLFGAKDGSAAADQYGLAFKRFHEWGTWLRDLRTEINQSPVNKFLVELSGSVALVALSKWGRLLAVAWGISAIVNAVKDAESLSEFVENLKGLSAMEWAGICAGLLMVATRAAKVVKWFRELKGVAPKPTVPPVPGTPSPTKIGPPPKPSGSWSNIFKKPGQIGLPLFLQWAGETGIRKGFQAAYGDDYREPPSIGESASNTIAAWRDLLRGKPDVYTGSEAQLNAQRGLGYTPLMEAVDRAPIRLDNGSIAELLKPSGTQDVRVTNQHPPPPIALTIHQTIMGVTDPLSAADAASARIGKEVNTVLESAWSK